METVLVRDGAAVELEEHLERLRAATRELYGWSAEPELPRLDGLAFGRLRIYADADGGLKVAAVPEPQPDPDAPAPLLVPWLLPGGLGAFKWRDRRLLEELKLLSSRPGIEVVPLLIDGDGAVLESSHANVWIAEGDDWLTPPADGRILPGVTRAGILAQQPGAREEPFGLARMAAADRILLSSSVRRLRPARLA